MPWRYWPTSELQKEICRHDDQLLRKLEEIIPVLQSKDVVDETFYHKKNLIKLIASFSPSNIFASKSFMEKCLRYLPPEELHRLASKIGTHCNTHNFSETVKNILQRHWKDHSFSTAFLEFFELPKHFATPEKFTPVSREDMLPASPDHPLKINAPYKTLKEYQATIFFKALKKLETNFSRFIIQMPTGTGKTRTAVEIASHAINSQSAGGTVVWLAHSEELCEQAFQCFRDIWAHIGKKPIGLCRVWGTHPLPQLTATPLFIIASFQKLYATLRNNEEYLRLLGERTNLIIVDEAHKATAPTYKATLQSLLCASAKVLGLTATPGRTLMTETKELADFFFEDIITAGGNGDGDGESIAYFRKEKILSETIHEPLYTNLDYTLSPSDLKALENHFDFPAGFLEGLGADSLRNVEIMKRLLEIYSTDSSTLFFACSIKHSQFISALATYFGIPSAHLDGSTPPNRRTAVIEDFKQRKIKLLCNYGVLSTGFDAPNTDCVFITRPTASAVLYSQMIGRGLRGPAVGGTSECRIVDVRDNIIGFGGHEKVYEAFAEYWIPEELS